MKDFWANNKREQMNVFILHEFSKIQAPLQTRQERFVLSETKCNQCGPESGFTNSLQIITRLPAEIHQESEVHGTLFVQ